MKNKSLLFLLLCCSFLSKVIGQGMLDDEIELAIQKSWSKPFFESWIDYELIYTCPNSDSIIIDSIKGKKYEYLGAFGDFQPYNPFIENEAEVHSILVTGDLIYLIFDRKDTFQQALALFYDFSLQVGDSFPIIRTHPRDTAPTMYQVVDRGKMEMVNNSKHDYLKLTSKGWDTLTWIKGLGSLEYGFNMTRQSFFETGYELLMVCSDTGDLLFKKNLNQKHVDSTCNWPSTLGLETQFALKPISITNPISSKAKILSTNKNSSLLVKVFDQNGRLVLKELIRSKEWEFNHNYLPHGLYLIHVLDTNTGNTAVGKVVKND